MTYISEEMLAGRRNAIGGSSRLIIVDDGNAKGFVQGASLVFRAGLAAGDYHMVK